MVLDEVVARLAAFKPSGFPVLSLYLNTEPDQDGRDNFGPFVRKELKSRARTFAPGTSERESYDADAKKIQEYLDGELNASANGLAVFACAGADLFEAIQLDAPIGEHRLYVYSQPHLYHLARLNDEYPRYAAVLADTNSARIFVFGLGAMLAKHEVQNEKTRTVKVGGWSQQRYRRRTENFRAEHAEDVVRTLERVVREEKIPSIVLAGDEVIVPLLRDAMTQELSEKVVDVLKLDINAPDADVLRSTLETMREHDAQDDAGKARRLFEEHRAAGLASVGLAETLAALELGQVDELLISASLEQLHPEEEEIAEPLAMHAGAASASNTATRSVMLPDELVTRAKQGGARVTFIEDPQLLAGVGGVGAFLRFRI